jgi:hypothetical protein
MKAIFLISSIFYILGLKIGHKINLIKSCNPVQKISTTTHAVKQATKAVYFSDEVQPKTSSDTIKNEDVKDKKEAETNNL